MKEKRNTIFLKDFKQLKIVFLICISGFSCSVFPNSKRFISTEFRSFSQDQKLDYIHNFPFWEIKAQDERISILNDMLYITGLKNETEAKNLICFYACWNLDSLGFQKVFQSTQEEVLQTIYLNAKQQDSSVQEIIFQFYYRGYINTRPSKIKDEDQYLNILQTFEKMNNLGFDKFEDYRIDAVLFSMAKFMFEIEDLERGFEYLTLAEKFIHKDDVGGLIFVFVNNYIQEYWKRKGDFEKSIKYSKQIVDFLTNSNLSSSIHPIEWQKFWIGLSNLEIANQFIEQGDLKVGKLYLESGLELVKEIVTLNKDYPTYLIAEFDALQTSIALELKLNNIEHLGDRMKRSEEILVSLKKPHKIELSGMIKFYENYSTYFELKNDYKQSLSYSKLSKTLADSLKLKNDARKFERINKRLIFEKNAKEVKETEDMRNIILVFASLLAFGLLFVLFKYILLIRRSKLKSIKLQRAKHNVQTLANTMVHSSIQIEQLQIENKMHLENETKISTRDELLKKQILTPEDWVEFKLNFERVYPGFINEMKENFEKITHAELRILVLERLDLDVNEMALKLGVNKNTIYQTKRRFKKKYETIYTE